MSIVAAGGTPHGEVLEKMEIYLLFLQLGRLRLVSGTIKS
jgi:hypothetical protein